MRKNLFRFTLIAIVTALLGAGLLLPQNAASQGSGSSDSVPVYETNEDMLADIETTAEKTTDILDQMYEEWDFFINNEETKYEYFKQTQDQITEFLQEDSEGNSRIIEDWRDYLAIPSEKTAKVFSSELDEDFLCESFNEQIKQMFNPEEAVNFSERGPGGAGCTINDTVSDINAFYDDFSQGGWVAFHQLFEPQNNIMGAFMLARTELEERKKMAYEAAKIEGLANQGFVSERECLEESEDEICLKSRILTPGYVYAEGLAKTSFAQLDYVINAGDLNDYSEDIGNTFLDRMLEELVGFLKMQTDETSGYPQPPADDPCAFVREIFGEEAYNACRQLLQSGENITDSIQQSAIDEIQRAVDNKTQTLNYKQSTTSLLNNLITVLNDLLACQIAIGSPSQVQTQSQINAARQLRTAVLAEIPVIQQEITGLNNAISSLEALTDQTEILTLINELEGTYDIGGSRQERSNAQRENQTVFNNLSAAQNDLNNCLIQQQQLQQQQFSP